MWIAGLEHTESPTGIKTGLCGRLFPVGCLTFYLFICVSEYFTLNNRTAWLCGLSCLLAGEVGKGAMQGLRALWLSALPAIIWASPLLIERENGTSRICKLAPHWEIGGKAPMDELQGHIVVVALLKAS